MRKGKSSFLRKHSLSLVSVGILLLWLVLYSISDDQTHWGSFFGNAIADWTGVVVTVLATKYFFERGSEESRKPKERGVRGHFARLWREHSLTFVLVLTGAGWVLLFARSDPQSKWGQVAGNIVSEWTQILGMVLMTKKLIEIGSKESH